LQPLASQKFDDEMVVLSFDLWHPAKSFATLIDRMAALLELENQSLQQGADIYEVGILAGG
jgi:hypothetical protein